MCVKAKSQPTSTVLTHTQKPNRTNDNNNGNEALIYILDTQYK